MKNLCLFLKPEVMTPEGRDRQRNDIETFIKPAIQESGLSAIDDQLDGIEVSEISDELIQKICDADVIIIDANCYETGGAFQLSPYLYYYMAIGHSLGNVTILVTNTKTHLTPKLITYHTLAYSVREFRNFINKFKTAVEEIRQWQNVDKPDNPIQDYLRLVANQEELAKARRRIAEMEARQRQGRPPIAFRKVAKEDGSKM